MNTFKSFEALLYGSNASSFNDIALSLFKFQAENNIIYQQYLSNLSVSVETVHDLHEIPFMPISFFKSKEIKTTAWESSCVFSSSGTTGSNTSMHHIWSKELYLQHSKRIFESFFGKLLDYHILALLPSYLERSNSSLVAMVDFFIQESRSPKSGFYLTNENKLLTDLMALRDDSRKTILWGVSFALLDFATKYQPDLHHCQIIETGGMKGRRQEITRQELHSLLQKDFQVDSIISEYGMTELLSQAYTRGKNRFYCPGSMKVIGREVTDPFNTGIIGEVCGLNVIDLANFHSISFIETEDIGKVYEDGSFEVLGRMDNSEVRGCNLLVN